MKRYILLLFIMLCSLSYRCAGQSILWERLYPNGAIFYSLVKLADSNLVAVAIRLNDTTSTFPVRLVKYDILGNQLLSKPYRTLSGYEHDIKQADNGKLVFAGSVLKDGIGTTNYSDDFLQQVNASTLDTQATWVRIYHTPFTSGYSYPSELILLPNGDMLVSGMETTPNLPGAPATPFKYYTLRRTDSQGNTIWFNRYAKNINTFGSRMLLNRNGNLVLVGVNTRPYILGQIYFHPFLMEIGLNGDSLQGKKVVVKENTEDEAINRRINNIIQTQDGGYVFGGYYYQVPSSGYVAKIDEQFNFLWRYDEEIGPDHTVTVTKVVELQDSSVLVLAERTTQAMQSSMHLIRLSQTGQVLSRDTLNSQLCPAGSVLPYQMRFLPDTSLIICGWCISNNQAYISRWGNLNLPPPVGLISSSPEQVQQQTYSLGQSYPNPGQTVATIPYTLPQSIGTAQIRVVDVVTGRTVHRQQLSTQAGKADLKLDLAQFSSGCFAYTLIIDDKPVATRKMVVIK